MRATKTAFLNAYAVALRNHYPWAKDEAHLAKFMYDVESVLFGEGGRWRLSPASPPVIEAFAQIGVNQKPSMAYLMKLPDD